jgi:hypothetical protein
MFLWKKKNNNATICGAQTNKKIRRPAPILISNRVLLTRMVMGGMEPKHLSP